MSDRRAQHLNPADGAGAPGSTGAFKTSDPLGAPGSTGAGLTHHDPTSIPGVTESDYGGGQQQLRNPTQSGHTGIQHKLHDPLSGLGHHIDPTSGVGLGSGAQQHQNRDPNSGIRLGGTGQDQQQHLNPTAGAGYGGTGIGTRQHEEMVDSNSGIIGFDEKSEFARGQGAGGVTGFTRVTTAAAPAAGGGMVYEREMAAARAEQEGREEKKGIAEKAREVKDKIKGTACGGHSR